MMIHDSQDWLGLKDKICIITGAGGGIGTAMAIRLANAGAAVVLLDQQESKILKTAEVVKQKTGIEPVVQVCDVTDPASVAASAQACLGKVGPCDLLINNAALLRPGSLEEITLSEWNALIAVNLTGYFLCAQTFGRQMRIKSSGAMVHIASISGTHPQGFSGAYSVSKAGVAMLSRQIAIEWGGFGIRSNVVSPGMVETEMSSKFYEAPGVRERRSAVIPMGRIGQPDDIADAVLFLSSHRANYISGEEITVDGGYTRMLMNLIPRPGYSQN